MRKKCFVARRWQMAMSYGKKTNLPCSSANNHDSQICGQRVYFPVCSSANYFVAAKIGCQKTNFLCCVNHQKAVFCNQNGKFTYFICETEQDIWYIDSNNVNKYKHKTYRHLVMRCLAGSLVKTLLTCLKKYLCWWSEIESVANSSNAFPGKYFVQYKLTLTYNNQKHFYCRLSSIPC